MPKDYRVYLDDIVQAIQSIERYTKGLSRSQFLQKKLISDAVIKNLEIIGEAVKRLPLEIRQHHPTIEWKKIAGFRDILIPEYASVDLRIVWDAVVNKLPFLKQSIKEIKREFS